MGKAYSLPKSTSYLKKQPMASSTFPLPFEMLLVHKTQNPMEPAVKSTWHKDSLLLGILKNHGAEASTFTQVHRTSISFTSTQSF